MVYSRHFDGLPKAVRERLCRRLYELLPGEERQAILEILQDTKPGLPGFEMAR
jgi:hypothetical protein